MLCYLMRHGKDDDTLRGGWSDQPLTEEGLTEVRAFAEETRWDELRIQRICTSDLCRAVQTADPIARKLKLLIEPRPGFREVNNGDLAGMRNDLALERYPGLFWNTLGWEQQYPGGESPKEFYERVAWEWASFRQEILETGENVLLVTHSGVIQVILSIMNRQTYSNRVKYPPIGHCQMVCIEITK